MKQQLPFRLGRQVNISSMMLTLLTPVFQGGTGLLCHHCCQGGLCERHFLFECLVGLSRHGSQWISRQALAQDVMSKEIEVWILGENEFEVC